MSVGAGLLLLWVVSPLAGTIGYLEVAIPASGSVRVCAGPAYGRLVLIRRL